MLRTNDRESEILLGNKQLLGIFFAVALLLGVAFYGGYMVGHSSSAKKASTGPETTAAAAPSPAKDNVSGGETHTIPGESGSSGEEGRSAGDRDPVVKSRPGSHELAGSGTADAPLGSSRKSKTPHETKTAALSDSDGTGSYQPQAGAQYLQVVALGRSEAEGLADVLHKKGFRAHAVPKPGNASLYRVIVGPIRDPGDLSSTRDALRKTGFREVIVQRY